jgi:tricorn protease-like protein
MSKNGNTTRDLLRLLDFSFEGQKTVLVNLNEHFPVKNKMQKVYSGKHGRTGTFLVLPKGHPLLYTDMESTKPSPDRHRSIVYEDDKIYLFKFDTKPKLLWE